KARAVAVEERRVPADLPSELTVLVAAHGGVGVEVDGQVDPAAARKLPVERRLVVDRGRDEVREADGHTSTGTGATSGSAGGGAPLRSRRGKLMRIPARSQK